MQITIIGLGQIGRSIGLALRPYRQKIRRVGLDRLLPVAGKARTQGAVDRTAVNLSLAVAKADVVLLALPLAAMQETLSVIGTELQPEAVVLDTSPSRRQVDAWVEEYLPSSVGHVGIWPLLASPGSKPDAALFHGGMWLASEGPRLTPRAWEVARSLAALCGTGIRRLPAAQVDALTAHYDLLPRLLALGLLNATVEQPGWFDGRKLAARPFAQASAGMAQLEDDKTLQEMLLQQPEQARQGLETLLQALGALRQTLAQETALDAYLQRSRASLAAKAAPPPPDLTAEEALHLLLERNRT